MIRTGIIVATVLLGCAQGLHGQVLAPQPAQKLAPVGADGKIERLDGLVELVALRKASGFNDAMKERAKPLIQGWLLDVQQQVIDNLDFMELIEPLDGQPGFFDTFDPANPKMMERIGTFAKQLSAPGSLLNVLEFRRILEPAVSQATRMLINEYDMAVMKEVMTDVKDHTAQLRLQYRVGYRDAIGMYHRLLDRAAPKIEEAVASLKLASEQAAAVAPLAAAAKAAGGTPGARAAVQAVLQKLTFSQKRALLIKVRDLSPLADPYVLQ